MKVEWKSCFRVGIILIGEDVNRIPEEEADYE